MARIVLLEFASNAYAEQFVDLLVEPEKGKDELMQLGDLADRSVPQAVVAKPTRACDCFTQAQIDAEDALTPAQRRRRRKSGANRKSSMSYLRSRHFGWWVHTVCKRPSPLVVKAWMGGMLNGANDLLPEILGVGEPVSARDRWRIDAGMETSAPDEKHLTEYPGERLVARRSKRARH